MRKILFLGTALLIFSASFAISNVEAPLLKADQIFIPIGKSGQKISYAQLATISMSDLQALTGRKMNYMERVNFRAAQNKIRKSIAADGTIKNKRIAKLMTKGNAGESGFHLGGFALGFFLWGVGVLVAYLLNDDYKKNRVKWAWIGFGVSCILYIILWVAVWNTVNNSVTP